MVLSFFVCYLWHVSPIFAQSSKDESESLEPTKTPRQINARSQPAFSTAPIARNPLANLAQADPSKLLNDAADKTVVAATENYSNRQNRETEFDRYRWRAANLHHRRLFFEDTTIEREAKPRRAGNLAAGVHFFRSLVQLPMRLVTGK